MPSRPETLPILPDPLAGGAAFRAQALGAGGELRGLKGGRPVLDAARSAYLDAQWRGGSERRATPGLLRIAKA